MDSLGFEQLGAEPGRLMVRGIGRVDQAGTGSAVSGVGACLLCSWVRVG